MTLNVENKDLKQPPTEMWQHDSRQHDEGRLLDDNDEEEIDVTMEEEEDSYEFSTIKFQTDDEETMSIGGQ